jgi:23S rRNA (pseudouridine1915-N3)-methyltransferase
MKINLWSIGKPHEASLKPAIDDFTKRISRYFPVEWKILPVPKNTSSIRENELKLKEAGMILSFLKKDDYLVVLDEKGEMFSSESLASFLESRSNHSIRNLVFLIGGAYGLDSSVKSRANHTWSLSDLTFPHQLVRLVVTEQLYRACTILKNEKYHHK